MVSFCSVFQCLQEQYIFLHEAVLVGLTVSGSLCCKADFPMRNDSLNKYNDNGVLMIEAEYNVSGTQHIGTFIHCQ